MTAYFAGQILTAAMLDAIVARLPVTITKDSDQVYQSQTTLQNDLALTCALEANSTYEIHLHAGIVGATAADLATSWSLPSGATGIRHVLGPAISSTARADTTMTSAAIALVLVSGGTYGTSQASINPAACHEFLSVITTSAGTLTFQHAQANSTASDSGVTANSRMVVTKTS